jgi:hypothetical protein
MCESVSVVYIHTFLRGTLPNSWPARTRRTAETADSLERCGGGAGQKRETRKQTALSTNLRGLIIIQPKAPFSGVRESFDEDHGFCGSQRLWQSLETAPKRKQMKKSSPFKAVVLRAPPRPLRAKRRTFAHWSPDARERGSREPSENCPAFLSETESQVSPGAGPLPPACFARSASTAGAVFLN